MEGEKIIPFEEFEFNIYDEETNEIIQKKKFEDLLRSVKVQKNLTLYEYIQKNKKNKKTFETCRLLAICFDDYYINVGQYDKARNYKWLEAFIEDEEWIIDPKNRLFISKESSMSNRYECERFISKDDYFDAMEEEKDGRWEIYYNKNKSKENDGRLVYNSKIWNFIERDDLDYFEKYLYIYEENSKDNNVIDLEEGFKERIKAETNKYNQLNNKESNVIDINKKSKGEKTK